MINRNVGRWRRGIEKRTGMGREGTVKTVGPVCAEWLVETRQVSGVTAKQMPVNIVELSLKVRIEERVRSIQ